MKRLVPWLDYSRDNLHVVHGQDTHAIKDIWKCDFCVKLQADFIVERHKLKKEIENEV